MNKKQWNEGLNHLDPDLVEKYVAQKDRLAQKKTARRVWLRLGAAAACLALIVSAFFAAPILFPNRSSIPIVHIQSASSAPQYYGASFSDGASLAGDAAERGISVTAQYIETLPDTYTFFDDWNQYEYRLLRMKTVKLLSGLEMTEEFYYMVLVDYMTDFSVFDRLVIDNMAQYGYEYSVLYNKTQNRAEQLDLVLFGYQYRHMMGERLSAFDASGNFDERLWNANEEWIDSTNPTRAAATIAQAEAAIQNRYQHNDAYVHLLKDISGEAENVLTQIKSFKNGLFVPDSSGILYRSGIYFPTVRYINGFATNEAVQIWEKIYADAEEYAYRFTKARFDENDMQALPDLASAFDSVKRALEDGSVTPPHFNSQQDLTHTANGIFAWYAKTKNGVIGIIRVTWWFRTENSKGSNNYYDDAYYIVQYNSNKCKPIDRDSLLKRLGDYETTYIYTGEYNEFGKSDWRLFLQ